MKICKEIISLCKEGYYKPKKHIEEDGTVTDICQCGERKIIETLSPGYAGWTAISKPCYYCNDCIPY